MSTYSFEPFVLASADDAAYRELWELDETIRAERLPDDPPIPLATFMGRNRNVPDFYEFTNLVVRASDTPGLVGMAAVGFDMSGQNGHMAQVELKIHAAHRRQGLGRQLLRFAAETAQARDRRLLLGFTASQIPAGAAFAEACGASPGLVERHSQLDLAAVDHVMLHSWQERAAERASGFELIFWDDGYPDELIEPFATLCDVMNSAPRGDLDVEDVQTTPAKLHSFVASLHGSGQQLWTLVARERATSQLVGFTELFLNPARPTIVGQGATCVRPEYRNLGLGRWLKAAMVKRLLRARPEARFIRTDNAETNAAMLAINVALGFQHFMDVTIWQVEVDKALAFGSRSAI
jgi:GNAT superfamily N-acetyltransferase